MSIGSREPSLTRQYPLANYRAAAAQVSAGMTVQDVMTIMTDNGADPSETATKNMFVFDGTGKLVEDELVQTCKSAETDLADQLIWVCRLWIDHRLSTVVEQTLTTADGKLDSTKINKATVSEALSGYHSGDALSKASSNLLGYLVFAHIIEPTKQGSSITGIEFPLPTSSVVPHVVRFVAERLEHEYQVTPAPGADQVDLALGIGVNHWINLSPEEFRRAARVTAPQAAAPTVRAVLPERLKILDAELRRRRQIVLQGPPGVGKTYEAMLYLDWAAGGLRKQSQVTRLMRELPTHERTPRRVAERVVELGLAAVWDIAQFHPSYGYEDFVRTLAPHPVHNGVTFRAEHRLLSFMASLGMHLSVLGSSVDVVLILDEINRADISRVFGELLYALEYRGEEVATPHVVDGSNSIALPENLLFIGTMNTADRSLALIDYALRRRFTFLDLYPDREVVESATWKGAEDRDAALRLYDLVGNLFAGKSRELAALAIGHSYFLPSGESADVAESVRAVARRFAYEVSPLLSEYAAEGLLDRTSVDTLSAQLGIPAGTRDQQQIEQHTYTWLTSSP